MTIPPSTRDEETCVSIPVLEDKLAFEGDETFSVLLVSLVEEGVDMIGLGNITMTTVYIQDNDSKS